MNLQQWADLDEDEPGELVDGTLVEEEVPTLLHELVVGWFFALIRAWALSRGGFTFGSEHKVAVDEAQGRKPDVSMYEKTAPLRANDAVSRTPPSLLVEVLSPRPRDVHRDRVEKIIDYARIGVSTYILVDPNAREVEIHHLTTEGNYIRIANGSKGKLEVPHCEGLVFNLDELWADADRLPRDEDH